MFNQEQELTFMMKVKRNLKEAYRVLRITKKPDKAEFMTIVKVTALGMGAIGLIGFVLTMIKQMLTS